MKYALCIVIATTFLLVWCGEKDSSSQDTSVDSNIKVVSSKGDTDEESVIIENPNLFDVSDGKTLRWIQTKDTKWYGKAAFSNDIYSLAVVFENLPKPQNWDFYEGWIVQKEPFQFISTGKIEEKGGIDTNTFTSYEDYSSYDFYVLTIEADDGNPEPWDHILEGTLEF